jgi:hypothetical protein
MSMQFLKLNKKIHVGSYIETRHINSYAINGKGIFVYEVGEYDPNILLSVIPERYRSDFVVREFKINVNIPPHTDSYTCVGINFYVKTSNCVTTFYQSDVNTPGVRMTTQTTGRTFKEEDLTVTGSFVAEEGDVYILDISTPHSVKSLTKEKVDRIALSIQTSKYNFDEVRSMLIETGYI